MLFTIVSLFLSAILMTQANTIEDDVTNTEPLSEEVFIFDVISDAPAADLKGSVESAGVEIRHSFQILGTRQYFFVVVGDLSQLTFPEGSVVTQYPVEHLGDFYKLISANGFDGNDTEDALDDNNLLVIIWEMPVPHGTTTAQYKETIQSVASHFKGEAKKLQMVKYAVVGRYPVKFFFFANMEENYAQTGLLDRLYTAGGPGNNVINLLRLRKI